MKRKMLLIAVILLIIAFVILALNILSYRKELSLPSKITIEYHLRMTDELAEKEGINKDDMDKIYEITDPDEIKLITNQCNMAEPIGYATKCIYSELKLIFSYDESEEIVYIGTDNCRTIRFDNNKKTDFDLLGDELYTFFKNKGMNFYRLNKS